jgi:glycosyltransferase involved in cell wall biosynthesis
MSKIKYSILMPYFDRYNQLKETLGSLWFHYQERDDFEVLLILDNKVPETEVLKIEKLVNSFSLNIRILFRLVSGFNPCVSFNLGAQEAEGEFLVITNPECCHVENVLNGLDNEFEKDPNVYVVCGCLAWKKDGTPLRWYQHSKYRNAEYHFCSALHKDTYWRIGGFDEKFAHGISYDDDAFRDSLKQKGVTFIHRDDLLVYHLYHEKLRPPKFRYLLQKNERIYNQFYKGS